MNQDLALPVEKLCRRILIEGRWPQGWCVHWIHPLFKRRSVSDPENYRGVQLTSQFSKVVERFLSAFFVPRLVELQGFGPNQFAYSAGRGARDAILFFLLSWRLAMSEGKVIALYCSDVSGAFDRVSANRILAKLRSAKMHPQM